MGYSNTASLLERRDSSCARATNQIINLQTCVGYVMSDSHQTRSGEVALQIITYQEEMRYGVSSPPRTQCNKLE